MIMAGVHEKYEKINNAGIISHYYGHWSLLAIMRSFTFSLLPVLLLLLLLLCGMVQRWSLVFRHSFSAESCREELEVHRIHSILSTIINTNINISVISLRK